MAATAKHLLGIYQHRLQMLKQGITDLHENVVTDTKLLVEKFTNLHPDEKIVIETDNGYQFLRQSTGEVIFRLNVEPSSS